MTNLATHAKGKGLGDELPAIYVADLADYNAGILRGKWIEIDEDTTVESLQEEIAEMLAVKGHEEYAIHDYSNFPGTGELGEYPSLETVIEVAEAVHGHGYDLISAYLRYFTIDELPQLEERFLGIHDSVEDYAREYIDDGVDLGPSVGLLASYFDYAAYGRDLEINGDIVALDLPNSGGQVAIFRPY
jgi:antirestriction protein